MDILEVLEIINTVFASIFYLLGIVMFVVVIIAVNKIKGKITDTTEMAQDAIYSVHGLVTDVVQTSFATSIINRVASFFTGKR